MSDSAIQHSEVLILMVLIVSYALLYVVRRLRRRRPELAIRTPIAIGVALRILAVAAVNATGLQSQLRGFDENTFMAYARELAASPWGRGFFPHGKYQLHTVIFAFQLKLLPMTRDALRVTQIGISMLGIVLIVVAVYDLAGPRAARLAAWLMALEPGNLFFNSALHKEPIMLLATGLVVFGGTKLWKRLDLSGLPLCALGGFCAVETRSYAGWFLVSAAVVLLMHAALRRLDRPLKAMPIVYAVIVAIFLLTPTLVSVTSNKSLQTLQQSQTANTTAPSTGDVGTANSNNLALEKVDFSSRGAIITNLPKRIFDVIFKPFPWQLQDTSQVIGAVGSVVALTTFGFLLAYIWRARREGLAIIMPLLYPFFFLLIAYALAAGNAGTGFRYRTHLVLLAMAMLATLRERAAETVRSPVGRVAQPVQPSPVPA